MRSWIMFLFIYWLRVEHGELFPLWDNHHEVPMMCYAIVFILAIVFDVHDITKDSKK